MDDLTITWKSPKSARLLGWENMAKPLSKRFARMYLLWGTILPAIAIGLVYWQIPSEAPRLTSGFLMVGAMLWFMAALTYAGPYLQLHQRPMYKIDLIGIHTNRRVWKWRQIGSYFIIDHPKVEGVRLVVFQVEAKYPWRSLIFDPRDADEERINQIVQLMRIPRLESIPEELAGELNAS